MRPRDEEVLADIGELPFNVAVFDDGGIRSCVEYADAGMRATMAGAMTNPLGIKELLARIFRRGPEVSEVLRMSGQRLVAIVRAAVPEVAPTAPSLVDSLVAVLRSVGEPSRVVAVAANDDRPPLFADA